MQRTFQRTLRKVRVWVARRPERTACVLLSLHALLLAGIACRLAPTMDEPHHLAGGLRIWSEGRFDVDRGNPPLVGFLAASVVTAVGVELDWSGLPSSFAVGTDLMDANGGRSVWLVWLGRFACLPISILGGYLVWRFAGSLYGRRAGLIGLTLWCFCPEVLAHGSLITSDMASAVASLAFVMSVRRWLSEGTSWSLITLSVVLGVSLLCKYVCLVLIPIGLLLWFVDRWQKRWLTRKLLLRDLADGVVVGVVALSILNAGYAYSGTGSPLSEFGIGRTLIQTLTGDGDSWWRRTFENTPVPFPADFVRGIDEINTFHQGSPPTYFAGEFGRPRWYYYLAGYALKLPLGLLALSSLVLIGRVFGRPRFGNRDFVLLLPSLTILVFVSVVTKAQFLRYALPALPFALIWLSQLTRLRHRVLRILGHALIGWAIVSSLSAWPNSLAHFNALAGDNKQGHEWLLDSSFDWGQDLLALRDWFEQHPERRPFFVAYFGKLDPLDLGVKYELPARAADLQNDSQLLRPGWYAVSAAFIHGFEWVTVPNGEGGRDYPHGKPWTYFQQMKPVDRVGYSILIYHVLE